MRLENLKTYIVRWTEPSISASEDELRNFQDRITYSFLLFSVVFGFVVMIFSVRLSIIENLWVVAIIDVAIYAWIVVLYFYRSLPMIFRILSIITVTYLAGLILLLTIGPFGGGGPVWLFFFPVVTGLLLNFRSSLVALGINVITLFFIGLALQFGWFEWPYQLSHPIAVWIVLGLNFMLLNAIATIAVTLIIRGLGISLKDKRLAMIRLEKNNIQLQEYNRQLLEEKQEREKAENSLLKSKEALQASELRFEELVSLLPVAYIFVDKDRKLQFANDKTRAIFNISNTDIGSRLRWESLGLINKEDRSKVEEGVEKASHRQSVGWILSKVHSREGQDIPVEAYISAVIRNDQLLGYQGLIVDVSDRIEKEKLKREKEVAEKANIAISEWVHFIAHELRTPVHGLTGFAGFGLNLLKKSTIKESAAAISDELSHHKSSSQSFSSNMVKKFNTLNQLLTQNSEKLTSYFGTILTSADRLNRILNDLLDLSKLEANSMPFQFEQFNLLDIINDARAEMEALLMEKDLHLDISYADTLFLIECDAFRIGQVFRNLLSNAIKFSPRGKKIRVVVKEAEIKLGRRNFDLSVPALKISISDQGHGIPQDQLSIIFEKFKQSRKTKIGEGTGLGLFICKEIISAHRGRIWAESEEGLGAHFHFTLPQRSESIR